MSPPSGPSTSTTVTSVCTEVQYFVTSSCLEIRFENQIGSQILDLLLVGKHVTFGRLLVQSSTSLLRVLMCLLDKILNPKRLPMAVPFGVSVCKTLLLVYVFVCKC